MSKGARIRISRFLDVDFTCYRLSKFYEANIIPNVALNIRRHQEIQRYIDTLNLYRHQTFCSIDSASTFDEENTYSNVFKYSAEAPRNFATYRQAKFISIRNIFVYYIVSTLLTSNDIYKV